MEKKLILLNEISEISKLAGFIEEIGEELSLQPDMVFNLNLVLEEAVSNVILYAYPDGGTQEIHLTAKVCNSALLFVLSDRGVEFDPTQVPDADITLSGVERPIGGLGVYLIRQIMNSVEYKRIDGENVLILSKDL